MDSNTTQETKSTFPASTAVLFVLVLALLATFGGLMVYYSLNGGNTNLAELPSLMRQQTAEEPEAEEPEEIPTEPMVPVAEANADPASVLCKDSYTVSVGASGEAADQAVATAGDATLTNRQLQVYYMAEVSNYRAADREVAPDFDLPLDCQICPLGDGDLSWQHYFLSRAMQSWAARQGLLKDAAEPQIIPEEAFQPHEDLHETYIAADLPVNDFLYSDKPFYKPNSMHQAYLDGMDDQLETLAKAKGYSDMQDMVRQVFGAGVTAGDVADAAREFNTSYMYFTEKSYYVEVSDEEVAAYVQEHGTGDDEYTIDLRHVLLIPEDAEVAADGKVTATEEQWEACRKRAADMIKSWEHQYLTTLNRAVNFARLANENSADAGSRLDGGYYYNIHRGEMISALDEWGFDPERKVGDMATVQSDVGLHIVYLVATRDAADEAARSALMLEKEEAIWQPLAGKVTLKPDYSAVVLWADTARAAVSMTDTLYPDIAHERFPEAITYLQQDYMYHPYGGSYVGRGGCGITTMAMLSTYMTDTIYSPGMLASRYPNYHDASGTNGDIFRYVPAELGFYLEKTSPNIEEVIAALQDGKRVISLQVLGHFTRGGHYLLVQKYNEEDDTFQVRDSNVYNYGRLEGHKVDRFDRWQLLSGGSTFWIMQNKITRIPACARCGLTFDERAPELLLTEDYFCEKCAVATSRRGNFLSIMDGLSTI